MNQSSSSSPSRRWPWKAGLLALVLALGLICAVWAFQNNGEPPVYRFEIVATYPHDKQAYCQGLVMDQGVLYEGTGQYGKSQLRRVDLTTGKVQKSYSMDARFFGEGVAVWKDKIIQLTWKSRVGVVYDKKTMQEIKRFRYAGQGWGLTHNGKRLIMSDGSSSLRFLNPETFKVEKTVIVNDRGRRLNNLNELEYIDGLIYANVWYKNYLACISPENGRIVAWVDLAGLKPAGLDREAVLNGIAYDAAQKKLFVTGKNWPKLFEIRLVKP